MPLGGPSLPQTSIDNAAVDGAGAPAPAASSKTRRPSHRRQRTIDGEALDAPLIRPFVVASRPLDASLVNATTVLPAAGAATQHAPDAGCCTDGTFVCR
jgi:hypothetical protein